MGFFGKLFRKQEKESLHQGMQKTKENFFSKISKAVAGKSTVDEEVLDSLEEALVKAAPPAYHIYNLLHCYPYILPPYFTTQAFTGLLCIYSGFCHMKDRL